MSWILTLLTLVVAASDRERNHSFAAQILLPNLNWILLGLTAPIILWAAAPILGQSVKSIRMNVLNLAYGAVLIGYLTWGYCVIVTMAPDWIPIVLRRASGEAVPIFEVPAILVALALSFAYLKETKSRGSRNE